LREKSHEDKEYIFPGERLGVIEEFIPGMGTYVEDGYIYSSALGYLSRDEINKEIGIHSLTKSPILPQVNDIVIGRVEYIHDKTLTIQITQINDHPVSSGFTGVMHISNATRSYTKTMFDIFNVGDLIRARVISIMNNENHLTTEERSFGVIESYCTQCGSKLKIVRQRLRCPICKVSERRKIAFDYYQIDNS
jgi:exosome complex component CSL4